MLCGKDFDPILNLRKGENMNFVKRALMFVGFAVLTAALLSALAPKAAHALVAALVQITNTSANPVPTYDSGTRFQAQLCDAYGPVSTADYACPSGSKSFVVPLVSASGATVKHLVVDNVAGACSSFNNPTLAVKTVFLSGGFLPDSVPNGFTSATHFVPIVGPAYSYTNVAGGILSNVPETDYTFGQNTHFSFNAGDTVTLYYEYYWPGSGTIDAACFANLEGTLVTQ